MGFLAFWSVRSGLIGKTSTPTSLSIKVGKLGEVVRTIVLSSVFGQNLGVEEVGFKGVALGMVELLPAGE